MPQSRRAFDPVDFLSVARTIAKQQTEGALRTAVSRAYYCVFHLARIYTGIKRSLGGNSIHWEVLEATKQMDENLGAKLEVLYTLRKVADYQLLPNRRDERDWQLNWKRAEDLAAEIIPELLDAESKGEAGGE